MKYNQICCIYSVHEVQKNPTAFAVGFFCYVAPDLKGLHGNVLNNRFEILEEAAFVWVRSRKTDIDIYPKSDYTVMVRNRMKWGAPWTRRSLSS